MLVATWLRSAARASGLREVSRRVLGRLRRIPSAPESAAVLDAIASEGRLAAAGRSLAARLSKVPMRPVPLLDAVLAWVVREAAAYSPPPQAAPLRLRARALDWALLASAAALALAPFRAVLAASRDHDELARALGQRDQAQGGSTGSVADSSGDGVSGSSWSQTNVIVTTPVSSAACTPSTL